MFECRVALLSLVGLALCGGTGCAMAQSCETFQTPAQVAEGLNSGETAVKLTAETCGLRSEISAIRGLVISHKLSGGNNFSMNVACVEGDAECATVIQDLPVFQSSDIQWSDDKMQFTDRLGYVVGVLAGDSMNVALNDFKGAGAYKRQMDCQATLKLSATRDALEGPVRCQSVPFPLVGTIGF